MNTAMPPAPGLRIRVPVLTFAAFLSIAGCKEAETPLPLGPVDMSAFVIGASFSAGEILVSEWGAGNIRRIASDGGASSVFFSGLVHPTGLRVEASGDVVVAENVGNLRRITADGSTSSVIFSGLSIPASVAIADNGDLIVTEDGSPYRLWRIAPDGSSATVIASGIKSEDVEIDANGNFIVLQELAASKILKVTPGGATTELFCCLSTPSDLVIEQSGDFLVTEFGLGQLLRVKADGSSSEIIYSGLSSPEGVVVAAKGDLLVTEFSPGRITRIAPDGSSSAPFFTGLGGPDHLLLIPGRDVALDIKPGSDPNCVNASARGRFPVAILTADDLDAPGEVDPSTVLLEDAAPLKSSGDKDVNGDGLLDFVFHFATQDLASVLIHGRELKLTGSLYDGTPITGTDVVYEAGQAPCLD